MRRGARWMAGALAVGGAALVASLLVGRTDPGRPRTPALPHLSERVRAINAGLATAPPGFVLTIGDSHAEALGRTRLCGRPTLSGGVGGAGTEAALAMVRALDLRTRPAWVVLTVGTNDLLARDAPARAAASAGLAPLIETLGLIADRLVVTAVPPIGARAARKFDAGGLAAFSGELERLCGNAPNCTFADPFAAARGGSFAAARPGALSDDLHLADYPAAGRALEAVLCPSAEGGTAASP